MATTTVEKVPIGALVLDIFDTETKKLIWRGKASEALSEKPEKDEKKLEKAVAEMFKHFPPRGKDRFEVSVRLRMKKAWLARRRMPR